MADYYAPPRANSAGTVTNSDGTTTTVGGTPSYNPKGPHSYGPRTGIQGIGVDNTLFIAFEQLRTLGYGPVLGTLPFAAPVINPLTGEAVLALNVRYRPDYFTAAAKAYNGTTAEQRKAWLIDQVNKLAQSWEQYTVEIAFLQAAAAKASGNSSVAAWAATLGSVAIATANPYAVGAGAVLTAAGLVLGFIKKRQDSQELKALQARAEVITTEAQQIADFHKAYTKELTGSPVAALLVGAAGLYAAYKYDLI